MNLQDISDALNIQASLEQMPAGSQPTFNVGNIVSKRVKETCSEKKAAELVINYMQERRLNEEKRVGCR